MGMYDVMPTLGNMLGYENKYALGHDIYDIGENNVVIFPSGDFVTNKVYYNNTKEAYATINRNSGDQLSVASSVIIEDNYIENLKKYTEDILNLSNDIIVHDLIYKEGDYFEKPEEYVEEGVEE
jgi:phosphoglycerol transferase MdoB-like AlkP superfamily enzyme